LEVRVGGKKEKLAWLNRWRFSVTPIHGVRNRSRNRSRNRFGLNDYDYDYDYDYERGESVTLIRTTPKS